jgi:hypothetical protein
MDALLAKLRAVEEEKDKVSLEQAKEIVLQLRALGAYGPAPALVDETVEAKMPPFDAMSRSGISWATISTRSKSEISTSSPRFNQ